MLECIWASSPCVHLPALERAEGEVGVCTAQRHLYLQTLRLTLLGLRSEKRKQGKMVVRWSCHTGVPTVQ